MPHHESVRPLMFPTVHINGSSGKALANELEDAYRKLHEAQDALAKCAPHGRDYYPQGQDAINTAQAHHFGRMESLRQIMSEVTQIWENVTDQNDARERR
jgi:hypothetical protein